MFCDVIYCSQSLTFGSNPHQGRLRQLMLVHVKKLEKVSSLGASVIHYTMIHCSFFVVAGLNVLSL